MTETATLSTDWASLWRSGMLPRFCFIGLGLVFHASAENMISTILPAMVHDIGGVQYTGWLFSIYQFGSILAGAATGRLVQVWSVRSTMLAAALAFAGGGLLIGLAPSMPWALCGRLMGGFGGGLLISITYVATQRYFPSTVWPKLFAILSALWGISAFGGPLYGGLIATAFGWRWTFLLLAGAAAIYAVACVLLLDRDERGVEGAKTAFPFLNFAVLAVSVTGIAVAGLAGEPLLAAAYAIAGLAGIALFFWLDGRKGQQRLLPSRSLDPRTPTGAGFLMIALLCVSTFSFSAYGPLLLSALHGYSPVATGLVIASESIAWSVASIVVASAAARREVWLIRIGALLVLLGLAGFAWAVPAGSMPVIVLCALCQGGGFGLAWPFMSRRIIEAAPPAEQAIAAAAVPTLQRLAYSVGAASAGIVANSNGFADGFTPETAAMAASPLFLSFVPLAMLGVVAAFRMTGPRMSVRRSSASGQV